MTSKICDGLDDLGGVDVPPDDELCGAETEYPFEHDRTRELNSASCVRSPIETRETVLRVGSLELDLIDRTAKRGNRHVDLRPREFQLLRYMMQRSDQLLTRADLFNDVLRYKFVPQTNLIDVHMGRLRRAVDGPNDAPMIRNVRGKGFVLSTTPALSKNLPELRGSSSES